MTLETKEYKVSSTTFQHLKPSARAKSDQSDGDLRIHRYQLLIGLTFIGLLLLFMGVLLVGEEFLVLATLLGLSTTFILVFPLIYIAYLAFRAPAQRDRLKNDFRLLGLASAHELDDVVEKQYMTVYSPIHFIVFITLIVLFCMLMGWEMLGVVKSPLYVTNYSYMQTLQVSPYVFYAFLGAYLFGVQELVRRYNTFDLLPQVYSSIFVRLILATGIVFAATASFGSSVKPIFGDSENVIWPAVAFLLGMFPQRGIDWMSSQTSNFFSDNKSVTVQNSRPLSQIIGISPWHESRLAQLGIDDAQNLAMVDIRKLLLTTQFDTQEIVNWIDQAILYVKVGDKITELRKNHINTFFELDAVVTSSDQDSSILTSLGIKELTVVHGQLLDSTNYPNYAHIVEFYIRSGIVVQHYAQEGIENILGSLLPYLATDIQWSDAPIADSESQELMKSIASLEKLATDKSMDSRLWMALGVKKQALACHMHRRTESDAAIIVGQEAGVALNRAIELSTNSAEPHVRRAAFLLDQVLHTFEGPGLAVNPETRIEMAIRDCTRALSLDPAYAIAFHYRALAYVQQGNNELALQDFQRALSSDDRLAATYMNRGTLHNACEKFEEAAEDFQTAYYCGFSRPILFANWGKALLGLRKYEEAVAYLSNAIAKDPDAAMPYADRGYANYQLGHYDRAEHDCRRAIDKDPTLASAYLNLGLIAVAQHRSRDAIKHFEQAAEREPNSSTAHYYLGLYRYLDAYESLRADPTADVTQALDDAVANLVKSLEIGAGGEGSHDARLALTLVLRQQGEEARAEQLINEVVVSPSATPRQKWQASQMVKSIEGVHAESSADGADITNQQDSERVYAPPVYGYNGDAEARQGKYYGNRLARGGGEWVGRRLDDPYSFLMNLNSPTAESPSQSSTTDNLEMFFKIVRHTLGTSSAESTDKTKAALTELEHVQKLLQSGIDGGEVVPEPVSSLLALWPDAKEAMIKLLEDKKTSGLLDEAVREDIVRVFDLPSGR